MMHTIRIDKVLREMLTEIIGYLGLAVHPDDPMTDYVHRDTGEPSYTQEEAQRLDHLMDEAFDFCNQQGLDIYELSMEICKQLHGDIFAEQEAA